MAHIAFGSQAGVGKYTAANYLSRTYGGAKIAFAAPLYTIQTFVQLVLGFTPEKDGLLLQTLGDWAKTVNPTVFEEKLLQKVSEEKTNVFVTDVRFESEFRALKKEGFTLVKLTRAQRSVSTDASIRLHSSETSLELAPWDFVVCNDGGLEQLYPKLDWIFLLAGGQPPLPLGVFP